MGYLVIPTGADMVPVDDCDTLILPNLPDATAAAIEWLDYAAGRGSEAGALIIDTQTMDVVWEGRSHRAGDRSSCN